MRKILLALSGLMFLLSTAVGMSAESNGPPPFVTFPILTHVGEAGLDHGHFVFGGEAAIPAPLAPDRGATAYSSAALSATATVASGSDRDVSNSSDSYEGETGAASNGSVIVGASNLIYPGNCQASAAQGAFGDCVPNAYRSADGATWTKTALPRIWNGTTFGIGFDPSIDVDKAGNFYFAYGVAPLGGSYPNAIVVAASSDGGTWTKKTPVTFNRNKAFDDKYYLAIDRSSGTFANRIYVAWDRNQGNNQTLYVAFSSNGGGSWSAPIQVNDGATKFERVIGAYPAVDHNNGTVYVSWHDYAKNMIFVDKSTTGGATWGRDVAAATTHAGFGKDIGCVGGRAQGPAHHVKVGPSGNLYLVYADPVVGRGLDILLTRSTDNGAHWSAPISLNDDSGTADQFHPTLSVESNGAGGDKVTVSFYDRRDDSSNCSARVYATQSTDSGATWSPNQLETSASSDFDGNPNGPGDYSSSIPFSTAVWPFFSDHRAGNPETSTGGV
jgi:hypothetical protein